MLANSAYGLWRSHSSRVRIERSLGRFDHDAQRKFCCSSATRRHVSYSGEKPGGPPGGFHSTPSIGPHGGLHFVPPPRQRPAFGRPAAHAQRRRLPKQDRFQPFDIRRTAQHRQQHAGAILFHLHRGRVNIERPGLEQQAGAIADQLARRRRRVAFPASKRFRASRRSASAGSPSSSRSRFGCVFRSRLPAP